MSWLSEDSTREGVCRQHPDAGPLFLDFYGSLWRQPHIDPAVLELCRLRLAQLHGSDVEWRRSEYPLAEGKKASLERWSSSSLLTDTEKACLAYTEIYAMDPSAITDEVSAQVAGHVGDPGLVALAVALGVLDGMTRMSLLWQLQAT